ncbi:MAG TPA: hypothetical protein PKA88_15835 [Polyangiaceae bacterium]|nr:hypothetical protein [Polyangiaceae bacterium]
MSPKSATLVVIEYGASWPKWLEPSGVGYLCVVAQHYEGEPTSLIAQVANRIARLELQGWDLGTSVVVANHRTDSDAFAARSVLARGLLARLRKQRHGELVLTVDDAATPRACQDIAGLAAALDADAMGSGAGVSVRIGRNAPVQGAASGYAQQHQASA